MLSPFNRGQYPPKKSQIHMEHNNTPHNPHLILIHLYQELKTCRGSWKGGWSIKNTGCSLENLGLVAGTTWHLLLSATPASGDLMASFGLFGHCTHVVHINTCSKILLYIKKKIVVELGIVVQAFNPRLGRKRKADLCETRQA